MTRMFSKTCEYGLRAMIYIAKCSSDGYMVGVDEISDQTNTPKHFTSKILQTLVKANLLASAKGPRGGFYLIPKKVTLSDIVLTLEGKGFFTGCALGLPRCSDKNPCPMHNSFKQIRDELAKTLEETTLVEVVNQIELGNIKLK